ncbi:MAG TPA: cupin domain-containing protein [Candidatus Binatia bacterium]|nr:cupin domain-containing protein [Candidatus Binatia bacterium]
MAEKRAEQGIASEGAPAYDYDYEARFIKQKREHERIAMLPRVIKPAMFAPGEFALGDPRVFGRYTVAPLSAVTCGFLDLEADAASEPRRMIPSVVAYIVAGGGESIQDGNRYDFAAGDVVVIPPYTTYRFAAGSRGFRAWLPQLRLWHGQGLLWRDSGLDDNESSRKVAEIFASRRDVKAPADGKTRYDWFLSRLDEENRVEREAPRVIRTADRRWEMTRHGKLRYYVDRWTEVAACGMDVMEQEIAPGARSGEHRHIFEELLLVVEGSGHDVHEGTTHAWQRGDLICVPPMIVHRHVNDGTEAARLVSVWARQPGHEFLGGIEHLDDASGWKND